MIKIGCKYEETKSILIEKLNDSNNIEVLAFTRISKGHACYFCGDGMFEISYRYRNGSYCVSESKFFIDIDCMTKIKDN